MQCIRCGKTFASHTDGPEICWECYMKDINNYMIDNSPSNCDMPLPSFGKQEGWICPVCGRGLSPWVDYCPCQSDWKITYGTSTGGIVEHLDISEYIKYTEEYCKRENVDLLESDVN